MKMHGKEAFEKTYSFTHELGNTPTIFFTKIGLVKKGHGEGTSSKKKCPSLMGLFTLHTFFKPLSHILELLTISQAGPGIGIETIAGLKNPDSSAT